MEEFCFNHFPAKLSFTSWSPEPSECLPVKLKDQIYSLCRKVNTHTQTQLYIYFIHLNMKYTFYRCFTRFLSVHRSPKMCVPKSPKMCVPKGHLPWAREELVKKREGMGTRCSICRLAPVQPLQSCLHFKGRVARTGALVMRNRTEAGPASTEPFQARAV